jgi:hypothetical protein
MANLLYKAKGLNKSYNILMCVLDVILLLIGVVAIFVSQMKSESHSVSFTTSSGYSLGSGSFGGGYILKEDARNIIMIIGVVLIILAVAFIESIIFSNKSYLQVFDDHLEGVQYIAFFIRIKKPIDITYDKINDVKYIKATNALNTDKIIIHTDYGKTIILAKNSKLAYDIIKEKIK